MSTSEEILHDFGVIDTVGAGDRMMKTEVKLANCGGFRSLLVTMTYGTGAEKMWQTFIWRVHGDLWQVVADDLERVIGMIEHGQGAKVRGRWVVRVMARLKHIKLLADLGPVAFRDSQRHVHGLAGEVFEQSCFFYEVIQGGSTSMQPFPLSSLRSILGLLKGSQAKNGQQNHRAVWQGTGMRPSH
jgi:hypothetical protein